MEKLWSVLPYILIPLVISFIGIVTKREQNKRAKEMTSSFFEVKETMPTLISGILGVILGLVLIYFMNDDEIDMIKSTFGIVGLIITYVFLTFLLSAGTYQICSYFRRRIWVDRDIIYYRSTVGKEK